MAGLSEIVVLPKGNRELVYDGISYTTSEIGDYFEDIACQFLQCENYRILRRNFESKRGEIDIIALKGDTLVFFEVKARKSGTRFDPKSAITRWKFKHITNAAKEFVNELYFVDGIDVEYLNFRFDVISIVFDGLKCIEHYIHYANFYHMSRRTLLSPVTNGLEPDVYKTVKINNSRNIRKFGRGYNALGTYVFNNVFSGFEISVDCDKVNAVLEFAGDEAALIRVIIDDNVDDSELITVNKSDTYTLAEDISKGIHKIKVMKVTEARVNSLALISLTGYGYFDKKPKPRDLRIAVYGDSLSSGYKNMKMTGDSDTETVVSDCSNSYVSFAAEELCAEVDVMACAGIGLYLTYDEYEFAMINRYSRNTCARREFLHPRNKTCNIAAFEPHIAVINLGTNDCWAAPFDKPRFVKTYKRFISELKERYGNDMPILLCFGMAEKKLCADIEAISKEFNNTYYLEFEKCVNGHPSKEEHEKYGKILANKITQILSER